MLLKVKTLQPVHPNIVLELQYRRKLEAFIEDMHNSIIYWLAAAYKRNTPELVKLMAEDASPAVLLQAVMRRLSRRWLRNADNMAGELSRYFATAAAKRSDNALQSILRKGGFSVKFKTSRAVNDVLQATIHENVSLIKSIAQEHLSKVEQSVMRSVQVGRDLQTLSNDLHDNFGVTWRRAELIARDQNNKTTAAITKVRQLETGFNEAVWVHSGAGRHPRPSHVRAGRDRIHYNIATGWFDPAIKKFIWPGTEISCRCVSRPVLPI